jgi:hypothetical protein
MKAFAREPAADGDKTGATENATTMKPQARSHPRITSNGQGHTGHGGATTLNPLRASYESDNLDEKEAAAAYLVAEHYANLWKKSDDAGSVKLYRTPEANETSVLSSNLWLGEVLLVTEIHLKLKESPPPIPPDLNDVPFKIISRRQSSRPRPC